jgi:hypothetical protein
VAIPTFQREFEVPAAFLLRSRPPAAADPSHEPVIHLH